MLNIINPKKAVSILNDNINTVLQDTIKQIQKITKDLKNNYYTKNEIRLLFKSDTEDNIGVTISDVNSIVSNTLKNYVKKCSAARRT